jgi:hypothetical protein
LPAARVPVSLKTDGFFLGPGNDAQAAYRE